MNEFSSWNPIPSRHPEEIAASLNHNLSHKCITAKVSIKGNRLRIILEASEVPNQQEMVGFIRNGIPKLNIVDIDALQIFGRQIDDELPAWSQIINLRPEQSLPPDTLQQPSIPLQQNLSAERQKSASTSAKLVTPSIKERLIGSGLLVLGAIGFLIVPVVGWIISPVLLLLALGPLLQGQEHRGACPYCATAVSADAGKPGVNCQGCKKRILIRDERFWKVED